MSSENSFNIFAGELQTTTNTFPVRFTFKNTQTMALLSSFDPKIEGELGTKYYIQGGPGATWWNPSVRDFSTSISLPVRITQQKELESITSKIIDYCFFENGCFPPTPKYFTVETGFFKTSNGWFVPPGVNNFDYNKEFIQIKFNRCLISNFEISSAPNSVIELKASFDATVTKDVRDNRITSESELTEVNNLFSINRALGFQDTRVLLNGSYLPNTVSVAFNIQRNIVKKRFVPSADANIEIGSIYPVSSSLNYSNDFPAKIGVSTFEASITIKQVLRRIDEDLHFSRGGPASNEYSGVNFIDLYFGPIKISRPCALAQMSEQPYGIGAVERTVRFKLLNKPKVIKSDFISVITGGLW